MRARLDASAKAELRDAVLWYIEEYGTLAAKALQAEVRRVVTRLGENPRLWAEFEPGLRRALLSKFPYSLIYTIDVDCIRIFAVAHQRRKPGYWRDRIPK